MSLPPGFLEELRDRVSITQVVGKKVSWDNRKSNQGRGDMWAPCPFHQEKTASFHVLEGKGIYHCFGCQASGDAISFLRETEGLGFMEAVEALATEAGMPMPARDPQAQQRADRRATLVEVMEQAVQYYRLQLKTARAAPARDYLAGRSLGEAAQARWELGFAPNARTGLLEHLTGKGVPVELVIEAGLAARPEDGGAPYDRFRDRIIYPIRDARGRAIAFGGRAMDPNARAKYLNSPETPLFDKSRMLYNVRGAQEAARRGQTLIVAEGYMDVIALVEAGFAAAVAPLGTAVTEPQIEMIWRLSPEPVMALDGDKAGLAAAMRVMDRALPMLKPGHSLRFCIMPEGQDPDDLIRAQGSVAMAEALERAVPMVDLLWRRETEGQVFDSPERKAGLDRALRDATGKIADQQLRHYYDEALKQKRWELFRARPKPRGGARRTAWGGQAVPGTLQPLDSTKASLLASARDTAVEEGLQEAVVLLSLVTHPGLIPSFAADLERVEFHGEGHPALRDLLLRAETDDREALIAQIDEALGSSALENLRAPVHVRIAPGARPETDAEIAALCIAEAFQKLAASRGALREIDEALEDFAAAEDEGLTWRLAEAARARNGGAQVSGEDRTEYDVAPNGARLSRDERSAFDRLLDSIAFGKSGPRGG